MADEQITSSTANIPYVNFINVGSDQAAPSAGRAILYIKSGVAYVRLDTGDPVAVSGAVALAEGRLAIGNGSGILSALALGTEGDVVTADASGHATWAAPAAGGGGDWEYIKTATIAAGGADDLTLDSFPLTYTHLAVEALIKAEEDWGGGVSAYCRLNAASSAYAYQFRWYHSGTTATADTSNSASSITLGSILDAQANAANWTYVRLFLPFYRKSSIHRHVHVYATTQKNADPQYWFERYGTAQWRSTDQVTSITLSLLNTGHNLIEGSTAMLYGVN